MNIYSAMGMGSHTLRSCVTGYRGRDVDHSARVNEQRRPLSDRTNNKHVNGG